jgi:hypothetical protein
MATMLNKKTVVAALIIALATIALASASFEQYYVRAGSGGDLVWNADAAYLFLKVKSLGYRLTYLEYVGELIKEPFGVVLSPDDRGSLTTVLRITPTEVQRSVVGDFDFFTPRDQTIYASHDGTLWKWVETRFEPASPEEERKFEGIKSLSKEDFNGIHGWSVRHSVTSGQYGEFKIELGGNPLTLATRRGYKDTNVSIDLQRGGQPPEEIWHLDQRFRKLSRTEYGRTFGKP